MSSTRAQGGAGQGSAGQGSAASFALPLALCMAASLAACGDGESATWVGVQDCAVGIPPQGAAGASIVSVQLPLTEAIVTPLGNGFSIRNFSLGPIGAAPALFSCEALQVTARFAAASGASVGNIASTGITGSPAPLGAAMGAPALARPLQVLPFECLGGDGRSYLLEGEGQADRDALFFTQTFTAWLGAERATLVCSTRFQRQLGATSADAGVPVGPASPFGPQPEPALLEPAEPDTTVPDPAAAEQLGE